MPGDIRVVVEKREGDNMLLVWREQVRRDLFRKVASNRKGVSREGGIMDLDSREEGSQQVDCRELDRGLGADQDLPCGVDFRTGATEG